MDMDGTWLGWFADDITARDRTTPQLAFCSLTIIVEWTGWKSELRKVSRQLNIADTIGIMRPKNLVDVLTYFLGRTRDWGYADICRLVHDVNSNGAVGRTTIREGKE